jgi:hypothetical protein
MGTMLLLTLQLKAGDEKEETHLLSLQARVVRQERDGVGFEFILSREGDTYSNLFRLEVLADEKQLDEFIARSSGGDGEMTAVVEQSLTEH